MSDAQWFYSRAGAQAGPVSTDARSQMIRSGQVHQSELAWRDGMSAWQPVNQVPELSSALFAAAPPPLPTGVAPPVAYATPQRFAPQPANQRDIGQDAGMRMLLPVGRSGWAIASGYLGLFSFFPIIGIVTGIAAVITGIIAIRDIKRNPERHGMGRAIFGIVCGALFVLAWTIGFLVYLAAGSRSPRIG